MAESMMAGNAMEKDYSVIDAHAHVTPSEMPALVMSGDSIVGVIPPHTGGSTAHTLAVNKYIMTPEKNPINDLLRQMDSTGSRFALVTGTPESTRPHEIIGIVSEREVAACAMNEAKLR
jgi:CBS domain containing-hemolysin-like protein